MTDVTIKEYDESKRSPDTPYFAKYPYNTTVTTEGGHQLELDSTPNHERLRIAHKSGSYMEYAPNGGESKGVAGHSHAYHKGGVTKTVDQNSDEKITGNHRESKGGDHHKEVAGDSYQTNKGDVIHNTNGSKTSIVHGDENKGVGGNYSSQSTGDTNVQSSGHMTLNSSKNSMLSADGGSTLKSGKATQVSSGGAMNFNSDDTMALLAKKAMNIASSLGSLSLSSPQNVGISSGGQINFSAPGGITGLPPTYGQTYVEKTTSAVSMTSGVTTNITNVSLTTGEWIICGSLKINAAGATTVSGVSSEMSTASATISGNVSMGYTNMPYTSTITGSGPAFSFGPCHLSVTSAASLYLASNSSFSGSTLTADGYLLCVKLP